MLRFRLWFPVLFVVALGVTACAPKQQEGSSLRSQVKEMTRDLALDSQIQRAFVEGREKAVKSDGKTRTEILQQNIREQKRMLKEPSVAPQLVHFNMDVTEQALEDTKAGDRFLDTNLKAFGKIASDPAKRNQLQKTLQKAHVEAMKEEEMQQLILKQSLKDQYTALNHPGIRPSVLDYNMDVTEGVLNDSTQKKRMMNIQMEVMKAIAKDPQLRPQLVALMIQLMKDPAMKEEMMKMMKPMMKKMEGKMKMMMKQQMEMQMKQQKEQMQQKMEQQMQQKMKQKEEQEDPADDDNAA